ncbi:saccharopine dehydrogenase family protein [Nocardia takedensis]
MPKIIVFGATGYTGRLVAEVLVAGGAAPVLAARNPDALAKLAADLGGADTAVADVTDPGSVRALLDRGDVLVTTVGPFLRYGGPALDAALDAGAHYLDSTGEGPFIRRVFERDAAAREAGVALITAFGFDYVPGNLAAALALRDAPEAVRVEVGYFLDGVGTSGGTRASMAGIMFEDGFALREGRVIVERTAARVRRFEVAGRSQTGVSIPGSEHLTLARIHPGLRTTGVYLGLPAVAARTIQAGSRVSGAIGRGGRTDRFGKAAVHRLMKGSSGGPRPEVRAGARTSVVAEVFDAAENPLGSVSLAGGDPYDFTARMLAWGARTTLAGGPRDIGALGPVEAFGLDEVHAAAGLRG